MWFSFRKWNYDSVTSSRVEFLSTGVGFSPQIEELKSTMKASNMPWPGDEGEERWQQAWTAIKRVRITYFVGRISGFKSLVSVNEPCLYWTFYETSIPLTLIKMKGQGHTFPCNF